MTETAPHASPDQAHPRVETPEAADLLCSELINTMSELIEVLERETDLLKRGKTQDMVALHARKAALSAILTRDMGALGRDTEFIKMAVPERIAEIKTQHEAFQHSLDANQDALTAMKAVSESLLHTIAAKVGARRSGPELYGKDAGLSGATPVGANAISVDRSL